MARLVWLRDGQVIDDSYVSTFESTVRNDLWIPALDRRDVDATITCEASNSNLTQPLTTSVTIDLLRNLMTIYSLTHFFIHFLESLNQITFNKLKFHVLV